VSVSGGTQAGVDLAGDVALEAADLPQKVSVLPQVVLRFLIP
jgi:hypothetical protein